jgi:hypothetical protein
MRPARPASAAGAGWRARIRSDVRSGRNNTPAHRPLGSELQPPQPTIIGALQPEQNGRTHPGTQNLFGGPQGLGGTRRTHHQQSPQIDTLLRQSRRIRLMRRSNPDQPGSHHGSALALHQSRQKQLNFAQAGMPNNTSTSDAVGQPPPGRRASSALRPVDQTGRDGAAEASFNFQTRASAKISASAKDDNVGLTRHPRLYRDEAHPPPPLR